MKKNIFYRCILGCLLILCAIGCTDDKDQKRTTLVAIRPTLGTAGTEITLYGEGFHSVASENIITLYGETAEVTEVNPNEYIKFIAPENPLGSFPIMLTINGKTYTGSKFTYRDLNNKIKVSTLCGGTQGTAVGDKFDTKFINVHGLAWIEKGKMMAVTDRGNSSIYSVDVKGNSCFLITGKTLDGKHPWRMTVHNGMLYIACKASDSLFKYDLSTKETTEFWKGPNNVQDVKFDKADNLYILCREAGIFRAEAGNLSAPKLWVNFQEEEGCNQIHAMEFDPEGNLIVSSNDRGQFFMVTPNKEITCIAGSEKGDSDGTPGNPRSAKFNQVYGFVIDSEGTIYTVDGNDGNTGSAQKIKRITRGKNGYSDGTVITLVGTSGGAIVDGSADEAVFGNPYDILLDEANRTLYVSDRSNYAIRKIEY